MNPLAGQPVLQGPAAGASQQVEPAPILGQGTSQIVVPDLHVESPPIRTDKKANAVDYGSIFVAQLLTFAAIYQFSTKPFVVAGKTILEATVGGSLPRAAFFNGLFLFGRFNEFYEGLLNQATGYSNDRVPERPLIDLAGPARALYGALSYVPGISVRFSELNRKILQRDFEPQVQRLIQAAQFRLEGFQGRAVDFQTAQADRNSLIQYIESGANPASILPTIHQIDTVVTLSHAAPQIAIDSAAGGIFFGQPVVNQTQQPDPFGVLGAAVIAEFAQGEADQKAGKVFPSWMIDP